ncbi:M23 family metallopeptidase [Streptomyces albipurpureus]|uniref:M23 family metallopeptidase n=1 Tax=Streptomyces albipurpureus TaxID=2897419 RepID=A0ABT0ULU3_9ACTN|nr:M23 family metallopeptidase [Streptomyces sp. CWNU-1]MCM2389399.1 M23 family metallopeptidase [Streptomyces sp. CWNU-1]
MNDQHAHAGHVDYDNNPTGSFDIDPLFGALPGTSAGYETSHSGHFDTSQWDTGSHQSAGYETYAEQQVEHFPQAADPSGQYDTTGQWDASAWNQSGQTGQFNTAAATFAADSGGQWTAPGNDSGAYDATAWNVAADAVLPQQFTPEHDFAATDFGVDVATGFGSEPPPEPAPDLSTESAQEFSTETYETDAYETDTYEADPYGAVAYQTGTYEAGPYETGSHETAAYGTGTYDAGTYDGEAFATGVYEGQSEGALLTEELDSTGELLLDVDPDHEFVLDTDGLDPGLLEDGSAENDFTDAAADHHLDAELGLITPVTPVSPRPVRRANGSGNRGRRRTPAKRSAFLTVAVPSACVMGVAGIAAASVGSLSGGDVKKDDSTKLAAADVATTAAKTAAANNKMDTQLAALHAEARDFGDRASRTQERIDLKARQAADRKKREDEAKRREALRPKFSLPVRQPGISAYYGQSGVNWVSLHTGIDFPVGYGTEVLAATDGTVRTQTHSAYGNMVILTAPDGTETWYCHLSSARIRSGTVKAGDVIGYAGDSGNSIGPHLHFEVRPGGGAAINPLTWLQSHGLNPA